MPTLLLVRHGRTAANAGGVLAGRTPGVDLDDTGRAQVSALAERMSPLPLASLVTSPLERCRQTADVLAATGGTAKVPRTDPVVDERLSECDYGDWTGKTLKALASEAMWAVVQAHPSAAAFPGGETLRNVQSRAVDAVREHDARIAADHGESAVWALVSHGDVIKALLADALGMHLDAFQRIAVDPCSVSIVSYTPLRPFVLRSNDTGGDLTAYMADSRKDRRRRKRSSDAAVGGGSGPAT
ncbi:MAG TPA: histidine phosphatase family protein [Actinomycetales bacterium]|nr:histidine phosphatase family protein [Actinomycetales bacterium]